MNVERSDRAFRQWMRENLAHAATHFGLTVTGEPVFGWYLRSVSAPAHGHSGSCWLRVGSEKSRSFVEAGTEFWTGNVDANAVTGVSKPSVIDSLEWEVPDQGRHVRAEVMTLLAGHPCSPTDVLRTPLDLPDAWWDDLRRDLDALRAVPTTRFAARMASVEAVETVHGDLHWNNVLAPEFALIDWEMWGLGPAGMDAASLYCTSLLVPDVADRVHKVFADVLDTPEGQATLARTASRVLRHTEDNNPDLAPQLRLLISDLTT